METKSTNYSISERVDLIKKFCISSNIDLLKVEKSKNKYFYRFIMDVNGELIEFHLLLKNIVNSGWKNKPFVKRIQIPPLSIDGMQENKNRVYSALVGNILVNDKPLLVFWNPFRFIGHKTNRSCYVLEQSLFDTVQEKKGLYRTIDSDKELIICDEYSLLKLIKEYIKRNGLDEFEL